MHLSCYNGMPSVGQLTNNRHLFLTVPETGSQDQSASMVGFGEAFFLGVDDCLLTE